MAARVQCDKQHGAGHICRGSAAVRGRCRDETGAHRGGVGRGDDARSNNIAQGVQLGLGNASVADQGGHSSRISAERDEIRDFREGGGESGSVGGRGADVLRVRHELLQGRHRSGGTNLVDIDLGGGRQVAAVSQTGNQSNCIVPGNGRKPGVAAGGQEVDLGVRAGAGIVAGDGKASVGIRGGIAVAVAVIRHAQLRSGQERGRRRTVARTSAAYK